MRVQNEGYTKFARAVAKAWIGENGAWKSKMNAPLSILPNCNTYDVQKIYYVTSSSVSLKFYVN